MPLYYLIRYRDSNIGFTMYASGINILNIPNLCECHIIRIDHTAYEVNLTPHLRRFQRKIRTYMANMNRRRRLRYIRFREENGYFPK